MQQMLVHDTETQSMSCIPSMNFWLWLGLNESINACEGKYAGVTLLTLLTNPTCPIKDFVLQGTDCTDNGQQHRAGLAEKIPPTLPVQGQTSILCKGG